MVAAEVDELRKSKTLRSSYQSPLRLSWIRCVVVGEQMYRILLFFKVMFSGYSSAVVKHTTEYIFGTTGQGTGIGDSPINTGGLVTLL
jgi:hypothetical protein